MTEITVRQAALTDIDNLVPLFDGYRRFYGRLSNPDAARTFLRERLGNKESVVFIAYDGNNRPAGFTQLYPSFSSVSLARLFILNDLYVDPSARWKGAAKALMNTAGDYARQQGAIQLTLSTATDNRAAQALYESQGWKRDDEFLVYNLMIKDSV